MVKILLLNLEREFKLKLLNLLKKKIEDKTEREETEKIELKDSLKPQGSKVLKEQSNNRVIKRKELKDNQEPQENKVVKELGPQEVIEKEETEKVKSDIHLDYVCMKNIKCLTTKLRSIY